MKEILLICTVIIIFILFFFLMKKLDVFIRKEEKAEVDEEVEGHYHLPR